MTDLALDRERRIDVDVVCVRLDIGKLRFRHEATAHLRFGKRYPDETPESAPLALGEELA
ncbi:MAG TPA: hypothetical protein VMD07_08640 [Candidatus Acidoferrales bacterium]|nr:hypothetical protein [Candidatus Acidoferrales bacterium]